MRTAPVDRPAPAAAPRRKATARPGEGTGFNGLLQAGETPALADLSGPTPPPELLGLLQAQEVEADGRRGRRDVALRRGMLLLERLESLRVDILAGHLPSQRLLALAGAVREQRAHCEDDGLDAVLGEIELRAEVEIAKLTGALGRAGAQASDAPAVADPEEKIAGFTRP